ncbi:hypothetical protein D6D24_06161 [Aureobasidium pullulans]|uniref:RanBD1 domain-containing protein n=1 Tax=Aureobasidium pullulans TaxID=5580 RepID=A0A4S8VNK4_AURPU|nr:hypothetical protein D6D24_06161 [Aureobasidium pullulans]
MSKRVADGQGGAERYGISNDEETRDGAMDPPRKATAAQLAKRSIKPLKGRPSSRSSSPSKSTPGFANPFGSDLNSFGQSAPAATSFDFGQSTTQNNPFNSMSTSQSFPPNAPTNPPSFAPPQTSSFNFGAPASTSAPSGTSFTFGSTPASPAPSAPASPAPSFNPFAAMSTPSFSGEQPISAAEIREIESAGPTLSHQGKLDQLANIVRHSEPKYKDADLGGLDLSALPAAVQRKMLDFVRAINGAKAPAPAFSFGGPAASPAPASPSAFSFGQSTTAAATPSSQPDVSSFGAFAASTTKKDEPPAKAPAPAFNFGGAAASPVPAVSSSFTFGASTATPPSPAPTPAFNFGASTVASASPAPASAFNFGATTENKDETAPKPSTNAFNFGATTEKKDETALKPSTSAFNFGAAAAPAAPSSPKPAEKKLPSFAFGAPAASKPAEDVSYPSLDKVSSQESFPAPTSSFSFGQPAAPAASSPFKPAAAPVAPESPRPQNVDLGSSMFGSAPAQQKPVESAFKGFGASTSAPPQSTSSAPTFGFGSSTSAQAPGPSNALAKTSAPGVATPPASPMQPSELSSSLIKQLNESLRAHLASADSSQDWSAMMRFYLEQVADLRQENSAAPSTTAVASSSAPKQITAPLAPPSRGEKRVADDEVTKDDDHHKRSKTSFSTSTFSSSTTPTKPLSSTASLFDDILNSAEKPQTPQPSNVFSAASATKTPAAPATAPPVKSNPFGNIVQKVSATPAPTASKSGFVPPAGAQALPSSNGMPAAPAFQIPKFGGFNGLSKTAPSFLGSFGQRAAEQEAKEREKRKEEDMDSDEDEEEWERKDAEKQAQKKAELLAASQPLKFNLDTSKKTNSSASAVFSFGSTPSTANTSASSNIFGNLSSSKPDDEDNDGDTDEDEDVHAALANASPAKPAAGKSLFDRVSFDAEKEKTSDAPSASFKFSSFGSSGPASDNTWKDTNPIKFGASTLTAGTTTPDGSPAKAPAPTFSFGGASQPAGKSSPFSGMFGAKPAETPKPSSSGSIFDAAKSSAPTTGFSFGGSTAGPSGLAPPLGSSVFASAATSRATTPGTTTTTDAEGSAAESEPSDTPNDTQKDLTALTAEELATSNLVHEARCKVTKFVKESEKQWVNQGLGPIRILASKETAKPRILVRADPSGKVVLNFNLLLNKDLYSIKSAKMVQLSVPAEDKKLETFMCTFKDGGKASEFLDKLHEAITKAQG